MSEILQHPAYGGEKPAHQVIAELRQEVERWTQMHYDEMQRHTETSVKLSTAEAQLAAEREAVKKIIGLISNALGQRHVLEAHRRTIERFHNDPAIKLQDELDTISLCGHKIHHLLVEAQDLAAAAVKENQPTQHTPNQGA